MSTLVHECHIFYDQTEWNFRSSPVITENSVTEVAIKLYSKKIILSNLIVFN